MMASGVGMRATVESSDGENFIAGDTIRVLLAGKAVHAGGGICDCCLSRSLVRGDDTH